MISGGDTMSDNKNGASYFSSYERREGGYIWEKAHSKNVSVNQFIKDCIFVDEKNSDSTTEQDDSKNDITRDIISILVYSCGRKMSRSNNHL